MAKKEQIVRHTAEELAAMCQRGESCSDWAKAAAMTREEIEASVAEDLDEADMIMDWDNATVEMPQPQAGRNTKRRPTA